MTTVNQDLLYTQIDVLPAITPPKSDAPSPLSSASDYAPQICSLIRELVSAQDRQTALLEELTASIAGTHRRRAVELGLWKMSNPELAEYCKHAAKKLERIQTDILSTLTEEVDTNSDMLFENEFKLNEFIDRFGAKLFHLNSLLQMLTQLGNAPDLQPQTRNIRKNDR
ncbi:MAG: hypothetical protein LBH00_02270 [Planctomycetaceae bacterium]|jgi:hypothetical protein|nr:hypothetical protein [Planctomycetaceae bacterium]